MRIRLVRKLSERVHGVDLSQRRMGDVIDVPLRDAALLLVEVGPSLLTMADRTEALLQKPMMRPGAPASVAGKRPLFIARQEEEEGEMLLKMALALLILWFLGVIVYIPLGTWCTSSCSSASCCCCSVALKHAMLRQTESIPRRRSND